MTVNLRIEETTLAIIIAGLYSAYASVNVYAVPYDVYLVVAKELTPYLENWNYELITFEQWVEHNLLIYPKQAFTENELTSAKDNDIYLEYPAGNVILIITASVPLEES